MSRTNGAGAGSPYRANMRMPRGGHDPLAGVLSMGPRIPVSVLVAFTIVFHAGVAGAASAAALFSEISAWNRAMKEIVLFKLAQSYEVEVEKEKEKEKEPEPPPPEEKEEPKPLVKQAEPPPDAPPQPPAAAEAAKVLTADPDPNEPVDMTNTIVQGNSENFAGGVTAKDGTSKTAVTNPNAQATGVPGGTGTAPAPAAPRVDRSRKASITGSSDWNDCPFPAEADAEQIDQAFVLIQVRVKPDGSPETVAVVQDPGHGFGREARKCAMRKKYTTALDPDGNPVAGQTNPFRVRFER